jgi:hypothetical protein
MLLDDPRRREAASGGHGGPSQMRRSGVPFVKLLYTERMRP